MLETFFACALMAIILIYTAGIASMIVFCARNWSTFVGPPTITNRLVSSILLTLLWPLVVWNEMRD